jgi:hypothetical protein
MNENLFESGVCCYKFDANLVIFAHVLDSFQYSFGHVDDRRRTEYYVLTTTKMAENTIEHWKHMAEKYKSE